MEIDHRGQPQANRLTNARIEELQETGMLVEAADREGHIVGGMVPARSAPETVKRLGKGSIGLASSARRTTGKSALS